MPVMAGPVVPPSRKTNLAIIVGLGVLLALAVGARFFLVTPPGRTAPRISLTPTPNPTIRNPVAIARPVPDAPPEAPATATFEFTSKATGHKTSFYVLGWVTNTSSFPIDRPKVVAVMLDAEGKEVGTAQGFASGHDLGPGEKSTIKILINNPPAHANLRYEVMVRKASYRSPRVSGLRVEPVDPKRAAFGSSWDVSGKVFHEGTEPAQYVRVSILALDKDSKLIGLHETFAQGTTEILQPGQSGRFTALSAFPDTTPARFEFQVDATAAKR